MKTVTLDIADRKVVSRRALEAFRGRRQGARVSFASPEVLFGVLTVKRWDIVRALTGVGPVSIREAARRVRRDVKAVHGDVHALLKAGILHRTKSGRIEFPFDAIHVDFMLHAA